MMCICQLFYQFYLYPRLGPPLGKFNHLQMFRLGCFLYIPAYLCLPLLRSVASPDSDGGILVMTRESFLLRLGLADHQYSLLSLRSGIVVVH